MLDANDVDDSSQQIPDSEKGGFQRRFGTWASRARRAACWARPFLGRVGILRIANLFGKPRRTNSFGLTPEQQAELDHLSDNATTQQATEACAREESMRQVRAAGGLRSIPLTVIVSNAGRYRSSSQDLTKTAEEKNRVDKVPNALASLSADGRVVPIEGDLKPEAIVRSILDVLRTDQDSKRLLSPPPFSLRGELKPQLLSCRQVFTNHIRMMRRVIAQTSVCATARQASRCLISVLQNCIAQRNRLATESCNSSNTRRNSW
jgi:hypothetical protein